MITLLENSRLQALFFLDFHDFIFKLGVGCFGQLELGLHFSNLSLNFGSRSLYRDQGSFLLVLEISFMFVSSKTDLSCRR